MLVRVASWCYARRRLVVFVWVLALAGSIALSSAFGADFKADYFAPGSESKAAVDQLQAKFPQRAGDTVQVVFRAPDGVRSPAARAAIEGLLNDLKDDPHVVNVVSPFSDRGAAQVSPDGTIAYADVELDVQGQDIGVADAKTMIGKIRAADGKSGVQVEAGGQVAAVASQGAVGSEGIGFAAAALILLVTFGSLVAMGLPLMTAAFGIGIAMSLGAVLRHVVDTPDWAPAVAAMVGIGVGVDYALFIVTRYRSGLADGMEPRQATIVSIATAGRAVMFAGCTVVISMLGILVMGVPFAAGVAFSAVLAVLIIMLASITLLPAVLGFTGRNIERLHVPFFGKRARAYDHSFWFRWSRFIQRRPWPAAIGGLVLLLLLAVPFFGMRFGFPDASNDPKSFTTRRSYDLLTQGFGKGFNGPFLLTVELSGPGDLPAATALAERLRTVPGVKSVSPPQPNPAGDTAIVQLVPTTSPQSKETEKLVDRLRNDVLPEATKDSHLKVRVSGLVAGGVDSTRGISKRLPVLVGAVVLLSFLLLLVVFRSILVAVKAAVMNLLSIGAAYGVVALCVNGGPLGRLIGIPDPTPVPSFIPMMMFAILFGLSMDYEVFLLSRIREEYDRTHDNGLAVADGLAKTARVITAAAAIMVSVFLAFVFSPVVFLKMIGIGMAAAIFVDATLVRMVLVPATMELLGDRNWWLPGWLARLLPDVHVEAHEIDLREAPATVG
ncbi:MAG: putative drug exporter of the superfamily [Frankiaceae bacterium]|jgi:RND superfamily putative drug exporter|nr:putative drug exporter of the superfamily [Frankiaceae bacterium]